MSTPSVQNGQPSQGYIDKLRELATPIASAAGAIVLPFVFWERKGELQQDLKPKPINLLKSVQQGTKAAPVTGAIVGIQLPLAEKIEDVSKTIFTPEKGSTQDFLQMLGSSGLVAAMSSPFLAILNGRALGWGAQQSLRAFSLNQGKTITKRETSFVLSQRLTEPVSDKMKEVVGDLPGVQTASEFGSGAAGSAVGHIWDTDLTRLQKNLLPARGIQRLNGVVAKAIGVGFFTVIYNRLKEFSQKNKQ